MGKKQGPRRRRPPQSKQARRYGRRFLLRSVLGVLLLLAVLYAKAEHPEVASWVKEQMVSSIDLSFLETIP